MIEIVRFFGVMFVAILLVANIRILCDMIRYGKDDVRRCRERQDELRAYRHGLAALSTPERLP